MSHVTRNYEVRVSKLKLRFKNRNVLLSRHTLQNKHAWSLQASELV